MKVGSRLMSSFCVIAFCLEAVKNRVQPIIHKMMAMGIKARETFRLRFGMDLL